MTKPKKSDAPHVAGVRAGKRLASRKIVKNLTTAGDTVGLRSYVRESVFWLDSYRKFTTHTDKDSFFAGVSESVGLVVKVRP